MFVAVFLEWQRKMPGTLCEAELLSPVVLGKTINADMMALTILHFVTWNITSYVAAKLMVGEPHYDFMAYTPHRLPKQASRFKSGIQIPHIYWQLSYFFHGRVKHCKRYLHFLSVILLVVTKIPQTVQNLWSVAVDMF